MLVLIAQLPPLGVGDSNLMSSGNSSGSDVVEEELNAWPSASTSKYQTGLLDFFLIGSAYFGLNPSIVFGLKFRSVYVLDTAIVLAYEISGGVCHLNAFEKLVDPLGLRFHR